MSKTLTRFSAVTALLFCQFRVLCRKPSFVILAEAGIHFFRLKIPAQGLDEQLDPAELTVEGFNRVVRNDNFTSIFSTKQI